MYVTRPSPHGWGLGTRLSYRLLNIPGIYLHEVQSCSKYIQLFAVVVVEMGHEQTGNKYGSDVKRSEFIAEMMQFNTGMFGLRLEEFNQEIWLLI